MTIKLIVCLYNQLENVREHLEMLFASSMDAGLDFLQSFSSDIPYRLPPTSVTHCLCKLLRGLLENLPDKVLKSLSKKLPSFYTGKSNSNSSEKFDGHKEFLHGSCLSGIYRPSINRSSQVLDICRSWRSGKRKLATQAKEDFVTATSALKFITNTFVFAYVWSFGGCFERTEAEISESATFGDSESLNQNFDPKVSRGGRTGKEQFSALVYKIFSSQGIEATLPAATDLSVHSYYFDFHTNQFEPWSDLVPSTEEATTFMTCSQRHSTSSARLHPVLLLLCDKFGFDASNVSMLPTEDLVRLAFLFCLLSSKPASFPPDIILSGKSGVGKTQFLSHLVRWLSSKSWQSDILSIMMGRTPSALKSSNPYQVSSRVDEAFSVLASHVSAKTEGKDLQSLLQKNLVRQGRISLSPSKGGSVCVSKIPM